jgi:DNA-binding NarL/FixJ family response regulator
VDGEWSARTALRDPRTGSPDPHGLSDELRLTVLAVIADGATRTFLPRVISSDRLVIAGDLSEGIALAETEVPDVAFVDVGIGEGAGLAMVHHLKALVPDATIFALASRDTLEAGAHALALGGAGLFLLPLAGDELLNAVSAVRARLAERGLRVRLERESALSSRSARWIGRLAELADARDRSAAAQQVAETFAEATGAEGVAVYLVAGERTTELVRNAAIGALERAPAFGSEVDILDYARRERLAVVPLALRKVTAGHVLMQAAPAPASVAGAGATLAGAGAQQASIGNADAQPALPDEPRAAGAGRAPWMDGLLKLLAVQATTALALLGERDRATGGAAMKDPASSAYSFAYYVDVAGREIDKAKRYGRRFTIATILLEPVMLEGAGRAVATWPAAPPRDRRGRSKATRRPRWTLHGAGRRRTRDPHGSPGRRRTRGPCGGKGACPRAAAAG